MIHLYFPERLKNKFIFPEKKYIPETYLYLIFRKYLCLPEYCFSKNDSIYLLFRKILYFPETYILYLFFSVSAYP